MSKSQTENLGAKVDELQTALDAEQQQVTDLVAAKDKTIADLQAIIDAGSDTDDPAIQAIIDKVSAVIDDLKGTVADT